MDDQGSESVNPLWRILSNAGWLTGGRIAGDFANLVLFVVLARSFGPEGIGQYAYALGVAGLMYAAINLGLEDFAVRQCTRTPQAERGALIARLLLIQALALLIFGSVLGVHLAYAASTTTEVILVGALVVQQIFFAFARTLFSPSFGEQRMAAPAVAELIARLFGIGGSLTLIGFYGANLAVSLIPLAVSGLLLFLYSVRLFLSECPVVAFSARWADIRAIMAESWPFAASLFLAIAALRSNFIVLNVMLGDAETGIYASGIKLMEAAVIPLGFLGFAAYPHLSHLYHTSRESFWTAGERLVRVAVAVGVLISWALFFVAPYVVEPLLGQRFSGSGPIVRSLAGLGVLTSLSFILLRLLLASNRQRTRLVIQAITLVVLLVTTIATIPVLGAYGAVLGAYAAGVTSVLLMVTILGFSFGRRIGRIMATLLIAIAAAAFATYVMERYVSAPVWSALMSVAAFAAVATWLRLLPRDRRAIRD